MTILLKFLRTSQQRRRVVAVEWRIVSTASGLVAGALARRLVNLAWNSLSPADHGPPDDPTDRRAGWVEALTWAAAVGAGVGVSRLVGERLAASVWEVATGDSPPSPQHG